jgi:phosphohistidine phosphatase
MTHRIYFSQHGLAIDKTENPERPLSPSGIQQTETIANILLESGTALRHIFHSGKLRASQSAEIFASTLNVSSISAIKGLLPNDDVTQLAQNLRSEQALYVGHLPHLEKLVGYLLSGDENKNIVKFQNSAVLCLEKDDQQYCVKWLLSPELVCTT